jgi:hypothetical protein
MCELEAEARPVTASIFPLSPAVVVTHSHSQGWRRLLKRCDAHGPSPASLA